MSVEQAQRTVNLYLKELVRVLSDKADINKTMADKRKKLSDATLKLQKEESTRTKNLY